MSMDISQMAAPQAAPAGASNPLFDLKEFEKTARQIAADLEKAKSLNGLYDKVAKDLPQALSALPQTRVNARQAIAQAEKTYTDLIEEYDSWAAEDIQTARDQVDQPINAARKAVTETEDALKTAKEDADAAKSKLGVESEKFERAQKELRGLAQQIQDEQAQMVRLEAAAKDAHSKHQPVEAVIYLEDLQAKKEYLTKIIAVSDEASHEGELWKALDEAIVSLDEAAGKFAKDQKEVDAKEQALKAAKDELAKLEKERLDTIKKKLADDKSAAGKPAATQSA